jgi:hypothetical protein
VNLINYLFLSVIFGLSNDFIGVANVVTGICMAVGGFWSNAHSYCTQGEVDRFSEFLRGRLCMRNGFELCQPI